MRSSRFKRLRRWLYLAHRWLGIVTCLLFATWFVSGVVMMYVAFPSLTEDERRGGMPALAWDLVRVAPEHALSLAGQSRFPQELRLAMLADEPVYRIRGWDGGRRTVSAVDGRMTDNVTAALALDVARAHPGAVRPRHIGEVDRDQWSVTAGYDAHRPFHLIALDDEAGTNLYVSSRTGEVVLDTDRRERFWNWFGAIPHWIYVTPLRAQADLWRDVVLWISGISVLAAVTGLWIGILRLRPRRRYASGGVTPYRGWAAWHHLAGIVGGLTLLTFIVSGWLSMNPNRWFSPRSPSRDMLERYAGSTHPRIDVDLDAIRCGAPEGTVEVRFIPLAGRVHTVATMRNGQSMPWCGTATVDLGPPHVRISEAARRLVPDANLAELQVIREEDSYWYSHHQPRSVPVLRARFDDPAGTWFHIDPRTGEILNRLDESSRTYRWVFNAFHSFDLPMLLRHRPSWDLLMWLLSGAGLVIAASGVVMGWRRLNLANHSRRP